MDRLRIRLTAGNTKGISMITGFNHTSFTVADLDRAVGFWTEALGFEAASVSERHGD